MKRIFKKAKIKKVQPRATGWILTKLDEIKVNIKTLEDVDIVNKVSDEDINTIRAQIKEIQDFIGSKDDPSIDYSSIVVELSNINTALDAFTPQNEDKAKYSAPNGTITATPLRISNFTALSGFTSTDDIEIDATGYIIIKKNMNLSIDSKATLSTGANGIYTINSELRFADNTTVVPQTQDSQQLDFNGSLTDNSQNVTTLYKITGVDKDDPLTYKKVGLWFYTGGATFTSSNVRFFFEYDVRGAIIAGIKEAIDSFQAQLNLKADKTYVDSQLGNKVDKKINTNNNIIQGNSYYIVGGTFIPEPDDTSNIFNVEKAGLTLHQRPTGDFNINLSYLIDGVQHNEVIYTTDIAGAIAKKLGLKEENNNEETPIKEVK